MENYLLRKGECYHDFCLLYIFLKSLLGNGMKKTFTKFSVRDYINNYLLDDTYCEYIKFSS